MYVIVQLCDCVYVKLCCFQHHLNQDQGRAKPSHDQSVLTKTLRG